MGDEKLSGAMRGIAAESGRSMGGGDEKGKADDGLNDLYKLNKLYYKVPPTLSLVTKRTVLINQAQLQQYDRPYATRILFTFNTGEFYVDPASSYLYMEVGYNNPTLYARSKAIIAQGNALTLFDEIVLTTASGTEVCREQNKGLREAFKFYYTHSQEYINTYGQAQGAGYGPYFKNHEGAGPTYGYTLGQNTAWNYNTQFPGVDGTEGCTLPSTGEGSKTFFGKGLTNLNRSAYTPPYTGQTLQYLAFTIPMTQILGCFELYMGALFPAGALAGAKLELRMKNPQESLMFVAPVTESISGSASTDPPVAGTTTDTNLNNLTADATNIKINAIYFALDAFQLQDAVLRRLNQIAAGTDGLSCLFDTYDHTSTLANVAGVVEAQVQQARSRVVRSWCVIRDNANLANFYINSYAAESAVFRTQAGVPAGFVQETQQPLKVTVGGNPNFKNAVGWGECMAPVYALSITTQDANANWTYIYGSDTTGAALPIWMSCKPVTDPYASTSTPWGSPIVTSYQAQLGALFFPQQPITTAIEQYVTALYVWNKSLPDPHNNCAVTYMDFLGGRGIGLNDPTTGAAYNPTSNDRVGKTMFPYGLAIYGFLAEKSSALQLSGLPISNARLLRHKFTFAAGPLSGTSRIINVFTDYTKMLKVWLGGRVLTRE